MSVSIFNVTGALRHWFASNNIPTDSLTIILNFSDANAAIGFDKALKTELTMMFAPVKNRGNITQGLLLQGLKIKLESPVHDAD